MKIGFTGTRQIEKIHINKLKELAIQLENLKYLYDDLIVIHGCAWGADTAFHYPCLQELIPVIGRPTYNSNTNLIGFEKLHLPEAPLTRNKKIVDECDILIALLIDKDVEEIRSGTWATIRYARKQNKEIIII